MALFHGLLPLPGGTERFDQHVPEPQGGQLRREVDARLLELDQGLEEASKAARVAVRGEAHHFILVADSAETEEYGDDQVEGAERSGQRRAPDPGNFAAPADREQGTLPLAGAIDGEDERFVETGGEPGAGGMGPVVRHRQEVPRRGARGLLEMIANNAGLHHLAEDALV